MMRAIRLFIIVAVVGTLATSCKSKQKVTEITGADKPATTVATTTPTRVETTSDQSEVYRNETFKLADGETNAAAMGKKFHVVVGSFSIQNNAIGLKNTLVNEGNPSLIVVNEKGMFRVLLASFDEYAQARARINEVKGRFADAWVLVQK